MAHRYLCAQKLDAGGAPLWGSSPLILYDAGSLQMGNFPDFVSDGAGGAVFSWYEAAMYLQSYAQHVRADGSEAFGHNGVALSINFAQQRVSPEASYDPATDEVFAFWVEEDLGQSDRGV